MLNLTLLNIKKRYESHTVLSFDEWIINSGIYWLKGGNGTGKTTLFRMIAGQTRFNGQILLNGVDLKKEPIHFRSQISYADAEPQYPLFITGNDLLNFYKDIRHAKQKEVDELTKLFEMDAFLDQKIGSYSSGMLKKLSLICAFLGEVSLYLLDEPLITIDAVSADKLLNLMTTKVKEGKSFLISSHQEIDYEKLNIAAVFEIKDKAIVKC